MKKQRGEKGPNVFLNAPFESVLELLLPHETEAAQRKQGILSNNSSFKKRRKKKTLTVLEFASWSTQPVRVGG